MRGAVRPDGSQVHLLSAFHVVEGRTLAQREVGAKTNEIPELAPCIEGLDLTRMVITLDALHTQRETARLIREVQGGHALMIVKANQSALLEQVTVALAGTDAEFAGASWHEEGKGHGRREKRSIRMAPPPASTGRNPLRSCASAATPAPRTAPGQRRRSLTASPASPPELAGPRHLAAYARQHWEARTASITYVLRGSISLTALSHFRW